MKRHPPQHQAKSPQSSIPKRSSQPIQRSTKAKFSLGTFVWTRPLAILGGAWVVMLVVALVAVNGLLSPDSSNSKRATGAAIVRNTAETTRTVKQQSRLPLWLFGAIALSCAAGSILISKQAARPSRLQTRSKKRVKPYRKSEPMPKVPEALEPHTPEPHTPEPHTPEPKALEPAFQSAPPQPPLAATMPSFVLTPRPQPTAASAAAPVTLMQLAQMQVSHVVPSEPSTAVSVTVIPSEEKSPFDWGDASLADKLDLRKQRSISSLL